MRSPSIRAVYEVRLAAVDAEGRHGSVVRDVNAWKMAGEEFTYADLVVNHAATAGAGLRPDVEPHVDADGVAAYIELYAAVGGDVQGRLGQLRDCRR